MIKDLAYIANELLKCSTNFSYGEDVDRMVIYQILDKHKLCRYFYTNSNDENELFILPETYDDSIQGNEIWSTIDGHIPFSSLIPF